MFQKRNITTLWKFEISEDDKSEDKRMRYQKQRMRNQKRWNKQLKRHLGSKSDYDKMKSIARA